MGWNQLRERDPYTFFSLSLSFSARLRQQQQRPSHSITSGDKNIYADVASSEAHAPTLKYNRVSIFTLHIFLHRL